MISTLQNLNFGMNFPKKKLGMVSIEWYARVIPRIGKTVTFKNYRDKLVLILQTVK